MGFPGGGGGGGGNPPNIGTVTEDVGVSGGNISVDGFAETGGFKGGFGNNWVDTNYNGAYGVLDVDQDGDWTYTANNSQPAIQDLDDGETLIEVFTVFQFFGGSATVTVTIQGQDEPPCFVAGTMIDTPQGARPVETLKIGDMVLTADAGPQEIRWVGSKKLRPDDVENFDAIRPIRILKDCFGEGVPSRDLLVSPMHRILLQGAKPMLMFGQEQVLCAAKNLVNGQTIVKDPAPSVEYFHILFDRHEVINANDCPTESFLPGTVGLSNFEQEAQEEVFNIFPELRGLPNSYGPAARNVLKRYEADLLGREFKPTTSFVDRLNKVA